MKNIMPPTYLTIFLILAICLHFIFPIMRIIHSPYTYIGILLIVLGVWIDVWADAIFKKRNTTVKPHEKPSHLEVNGPFRISRHPMYLGMAVVLLGIDVFLGTLVTFVFPLVFVILMEVLFIPMEEKSMENVFGKKYLDYKKKVRRWI